MKKNLWKKSLKDIYKKEYIYNIIKHMKNLKLDINHGFTPTTPNGDGGTMSLRSEDTDVG
jgi:hypothetical protein